MSQNGREPTDVLGHLADSEDVLHPPMSLGDFVSLFIGLPGFRAAAMPRSNPWVNAIALPPAEDIRRDFDLFIESVRNPEAQKRIRAAMKRGFQTRRGIEPGPVAGRPGRKMHV